MNRSRMTAIILTATCLALCSPSNIVLAAGKSEVIKEVAEQIMKKLGKESVEGGLAKLTTRLDGLVTKFGDDAINAARKSGMRSIKILEEAGENGAAAARLLARHGDEALEIVEDAAKLSIASRLGDDAVKAMLKHPGVSGELIGKFDDLAVPALNNTSGQNARRLAMLADEGAIAAGESSKLVGVVGKYGDRAMDFIWRNKGALAVGTTLTVFLSDPEAFLNGTKDLAQVVAQDVVAPVAKTIFTEVARHVDWTVVLGIIIIGAVTFFGVRHLIRGRSSRRMAS